MIIPVKKVTIVTMVDNMKLVLEETGRLGVVQLKKLMGDEFRGFREETAEEEKTYTQLRERARMLHGKLSGVERQIEEVGVDVAPERLEEVIGEYEKRISTLEEQIKEDKGRLNELREARPLLNVMKELGINPRDVGEFTHIFGKAGLVKGEALRVLERKLRGLRELVYKSSPVSREDCFLYLGGLVDLKAHVEKVLSAADFREFKLPSGFSSHVPDKIDEAVRWVEDEQRALNDHLETHTKEWEDLRRDFLSKYKAYESIATRLISLGVARSKMLSSDMMVILQGWIPEDRTRTLSSFLEGAKHQIGGKIAYSYEDPAPDEEVPTIMKNPKPFRAYEVLTRQYGYPDPKESDPTPISTILWIVMFGMMFPDYGEGLVILLLGIIFAYRLKKPLMGINMARIGRLMMGLGLSAIVFGLLMGEVFLMEVTPLWPGLRPAWITSPSNVLWVIKIAVFFGIAQIILGISISIRNHLKAGEKLEALLGEHGFAGLVAFIGIVIVAFEFLGISVVPGIRFPRLGLNVLTHWSIGIPLVGLVGIFVKPILSGEGAALSIGVILEASISFLANILSYARIAGFAIAHAAFALVVGELLHANPALGIGLGLIFLNMFALTLELLVCMIQALRLLYYEFSTKFFKGSGVPYIPYRL